MKLLEEKGYTDTDRWSEETFDQDYRPVIHEMIEKIYKLWKKEAVERLADLREETLEDTFTETPTNEMMKLRKKEMLEPLSTPKQDD